MSKSGRQSLFSNARADLPAGLVVFLVAVPLCLGIAQASGAPPLAGIVAGIIGGTVVALLSGSQLSVSGPAAGLTVLVAAAIGDLGYRGFLLAVVLAGVIQIIMGAIRAGVVAHFFPSAVIKGMLAAIGVILILKQLPHAVGYDAVFEGSDSFTQDDGHNTFSSIMLSLGRFEPVAVIVSLLGVLALWLWPRVQKSGPLKFVPAALMVVLLGAVASVAATIVWPAGALSAEHLVKLPVWNTLSDIAGWVVLPDFGRITDPQVWQHAGTLAIVASIETLLSLEAVDQLDKARRISPPNQELFAQGVGNALSGLVGGIPLTSVIVRSSANVEAGGKSRLSAVTHGVLLLLGVLLLAPILNQVPLAALAVVLLAVGFKLTKPTLYRDMWRKGPSQFVPFVVTVLAVVFTDLLLGTLVGVVVGVLFVIYTNQRNPVQVVQEGNLVLLQVNKDLTFLSKARLKEVLREVADDTTLIIDASRAEVLDHDIVSVFADFQKEAEVRGIKVQWKQPHPSVQPLLAKEAA